MAGCSSGSKFSPLIIVIYFANLVSGELVGHFATGVLNCLGLKAQDQDRDSNPQDQNQDS